MSASAVSQSLRSSQDHSSDETRKETADPRFTEILLRAVYSENRVIRNNLTANRGKYKSHRIKSKNLILEAANGLSGECIVIGLGNGMDVPLKRLTKQFDHVTVIDIDRETCEATVSKLSDNLQTKVTIKQRDLTGTLDPIAKKLETFLEQDPKPTHANFCNKVLELIRIAIVQRLDLPEGEASFICSSLVLSQQISLLHFYILTLENKFYPSETTFINSNPEYNVLISELANQAQSDHPKHIRYWLNEKGKGYISTTVEKVSVLESNDRLAFRRMNPPRLMVNPSAIGKISEIFDVFKKEMWYWYSHPARESCDCDKIGSGFRVHGMLLETKKT